MANFIAHRGSQYVAYKTAELSTEWREVASAAQKGDFLQANYEFSDLAYKVSGADVVIGGWSTTSKPRSGV